MTKEVEARVKIFQQAMVACHSSNPTDCVEWFADRIADLEKENAELKEERKKWKDEWQEQVQKATDEGYARTLQTMQLSKAKELLKDALDKIDCVEHSSWWDKAEKFLKESE